MDFFFFAKSDFWSALQEFLKIFWACLSGIEVCVLYNISCTVGIWKKGERVSCSVMSDSLRLRRLQSTGLLCPWNSPGKYTGEGYHSLLQDLLWPGHQTRVSRTVGRFFTVWATKETCLTGTENLNFPGQFSFCCCSRWFYHLKPYESQKHHCLKSPGTISETALTLERARVSIPSLCGNLGKVKSGPTPCRVESPFTGAQPANTQEPGLSSQLKWTLLQAQSLLPTVQLFSSSAKQCNVLDGHRLLGCGERNTPLSLVGGNFVRHPHRWTPSHWRSFRPAWLAFLP